MKKTLSDRQAKTAAILLILLSVILLIILYRYIYLYAPDEKVEWLSFSEEHFGIGKQLYQTGKMVNGDYINTERPPGYPVYVSLVLHTRDQIIRYSSLPNGKTVFGSVITDMLNDNESAVLLSHFLVSIVSAYLVFLMLWTYKKSIIPYIVSISYILSIPSFSLILKRDYSLLETFFILILLLLSQRYFNSDSDGDAWKYAILLGLSIGVISLFRPVYLLFFIFFFLTTFVSSRKIQRSLKHTGLLMLFMMIVFVPNVVRNYKVANKFILVSEQGGVELYHNSVESYFVKPEYTLYDKVWTDYGWPLIRDGLGYQEYTGMLWYSDTARISDLFWNASIKQITTRPFIYIGNVIYNLGQIILLDINYWGYRIIKENSNNLIEHFSYNFYLWLFQIMGSVSVIWVAIKSRNEIKYPIMLLAITLYLSYSLVFFYPRYIYFKYPLFLLSMGFFISHFTNTKRILIAQILSGALCISSFLPILMVAIRYFSRF